MGFENQLKEEYLTNEKDELYIVGVKIKKIDNFAKGQFQRKVGHQIKKQQKKDKQWKKGIFNYVVVYLFI